MVKVTREHKTVTVYEWHCPDCDIEMQRELPPMDDDDARCSKCADKAHARRKAEWIKQFKTGHMLLVGKILDVEPVLDGWWDENPDDALTGALIVETISGGLYRVQADSALWWDVVKGSEERNG